MIGFRSNSSAAVAIGTDAPPSSTLAIRPTEPASSPVKRGALLAAQRPDQVIPVPCLDQAAIGMMMSTIAPEYPIATPNGPWLRPSTMPKITTGVAAAVMLTARPTRPVDITSQLSGFANANTSDVGASSLKIGATSIHFPPTICG